jgi:hypothetical protein
MALKLLDTCVDSDGAPGFDASGVEAQLAPASDRTGMCGPNHATWMVRVKSYGT